MSTTTRIDGAGRIVIPKELRRRYGLERGTVVRFEALPDGVSIVPERFERRFVRRGPILTIDTGVAEATVEQFEVDALRSQRLDEQDWSVPR